MIKTIVLLLTLVFVVNAQTVLAPIQIPNEQSAILKKIIERQMLLSSEFQSLEQQKTIIVQRIALENNLTAKQFDELELVATANGYILQPKKKAEAQSK